MSVSMKEGTVTLVSEAGYSGKQLVDDLVNLLWKKVPEEVARELVTRLVEKYRRSSLPEIETFTPRGYEGYTVLGICYDNLEEAKRAARSRCEETRDPCWVKGVKMLYRYIPSVEEEEYD